MFLPLFLFLPADFAPDLPEDWKPEFRSASLADFAAFFALLALTANLRVLMRCFDTFRRDETFAARTDEILAVCLARPCRTKSKFCGGGTGERTLHGFFFRRTGNVDRLAASRVYTGVEHAGGKRAGRGVKILHLLGLMVDTRRYSASSMAADKSLPG